MYQQVGTELIIPPTHAHRSSVQTDCFLVLLDEGRRPRPRRSNTNTIPAREHELFLTASGAPNLRTGSKPAIKLEPNVDRDDSPVFDRLNTTIATSSERAISKLPSVIRKGLKRHRLLREYATVTLESGDRDFTASTAERCYDTKPF